VYILACQGFYKIGKSSDLLWRVASLQAANPIPIEIEHVIYTEQNAAVELALHRIFSSKRVRGEWFSLSQEDVEAIRSWSVEDILNLEAALRPPPINKRVKPGRPWPQPWVTIHLPEEFIAPVKILKKASEGEKPQGALFTSFVLIFNLAWESGYQTTPLLNQVEVMQYLKLGRRQYFHRKAAMQEMGWLRSSHPKPGMVQFSFDEDLLRGEAPES
jgi:hypothetical protein